MSLRFYLGYSRSGGPPRGLSSRQSSSLNQLTSRSMELDGDGPYLNDWDYGENSYSMENVYYSYSNDLGSTC